MNNIVLVEFENHRSRERIKSLGEVFTPEQYIAQMMSVFDKKIWTDENISFFEPSCGHGNILLSIFQKRFEELNKKYSRQNLNSSYLYAIATTLNTLWGIDICKQNVELAQKRILDAVVEKLNENGFGLSTTTKERNDFLAHVICTLKWQIHENETLSSLGAIDSNKNTVIGQKWVESNGAKSLNFKNTWAQHFVESSENKTIPIEFQRAKKLLSSNSSRLSIKDARPFNFAKEIFTESCSSILEGVA